MKIKFNTFVQVCVTFFTLLGFILTAFKLPEYGLISNLISQPFWIYSTYRSWKEANQIGAFITTILLALAILYGVINYWFL
ncbi:MAG: hypothetical protein KBD14_03010 [Candidatus Pacebacteria bacterium]|nr:hypothetical protein [Candidatus Paceibacterota bacterium]